MADCILCGDAETSHEETTPGNRHLGACRVRTQITPGNTLNPEGHWEICDCPGFEPELEDDN